MTIPKDIGLNYIQASIFSLLYKIWPHLQRKRQPIYQTIRINNKKKLNKSNCIWHYCVYEKTNRATVKYLWSASGVMNGPRNQNPSLAIDHYSSVVIAHRGFGITTKPREEKQQPNEHLHWSPRHHFSSNKKNSSLILL